MKIEVNEREALLIVKALSTYQNRIGQHTSWDERNRMRTIRARLADAVTIQPNDPLYQGEEITMLLMPMLVNE